ncbi:MAG: shikimate dehydrogenase [Rhodocyclales bacterium]|nr:shikimate dehydrogenase [Rhodocyclales bacterium]
MDRYAVIGNPVAHSKSPLIHATFARQTGQSMTYEALLAPLDGFAATVARFRDAGGCGLNVTVPFKLEAHALTQRHTPRAAAAGAANTLMFDARGILADNTDGVGLVRDLTHNLATPLAERRILLLGAGGAARGALLPLLEQQPSRLTIANRTLAKADTLAGLFREPASHHGVALAASDFAALAGCEFDIIINATAASLSGQIPDLPSALYANAALAYDMMYAPADTPFMATARRHGAGRVADGLGMLVEQAAESFFVWRGVRPDTRPVLASLRDWSAGG